MTLANLLKYVQLFIVNLVGGSVTIDEVTTTVTSANSMGGQIVSFVTSSPLIYLPCLFGIALFGVHIVKSFIQR